MNNVQCNGELYFVRFFLLYNRQMNEKRRLLNVKLERYTARIFLQQIVRLIFMYELTGDKKVFFVFQHFPHFSPLTPTVQIRPPHYKPSI